MSHRVVVTDSGNAVCYNYFDDTPCGGICIPTLTLRVQCGAYLPPHPHKLKKREPSRIGCTTAVSVRKIPMKPLVITALLGWMFAAPLSVPLPALAQWEPVQKVNRRSLLADLNLTLEQRQRIQQIRQHARAQIQAVLTPEQRQQLSQWRTQNREQRRTIMKNLNLTEAQKVQIRQIHAHTRQQIQAILTPEQRQKIEARRQQWQQQRDQLTKPDHPS